MSAIITYSNGHPVILGSRSILPRQNITTPLGINANDLDLGDISPIEDGWLELDSDDGDGNHLGSSSVSDANGYLGSVGSGQASQNANSLEGSSAACSLTGCATSAAASNGNRTSTSSTSTGGLINGPVINGPIISNKKHSRGFSIG
ncbi:hypothetical protein EYB26_006860 [Talaromyces marneffei]|uniref:Uncharacterized protein n=2 Tax=Talaromyces marneffei TaxID=37727 RepID=B6QI98_TALMQ|nr:uncharacterized protein EYB26_006860 [Talaromyces marneffei]EEA23093.1 hypothetical protein PMAA_096880 [Talaromyces marneffei ATCC 18224]QGA19172.1 hypothetical protein EYB26_006860 [Talaromyces marneffei]